MLHTILAHLANTKPTRADQCADYFIQPLVGGKNNLLYHVTNHAHDLVVKFTIRDTRDRAGREYEALTALHAAKYAIAPRPIHLDRDSYPQPVVVQTYVDGLVDPTPCTTDDDWHALITHYLTMHTFTPTRLPSNLRSAVLTMFSAEQAKATIREQLAQLPPEHQPVEIPDLIARLDQTRWPTWSKPPIALTRADPNPSNFIRRPDSWLSVDWENSGWGDPAFEIADMMSHPAYMHVPSERWEWVIDAYCRGTHDPTAELRIRTYYSLMLSWWVVRFARYLYDIPRGADRRLAPLAPDWQSTTRQKYDHYVQLALA